MNEIKGRVINVSNRLPVLIRKHAGGARLERSSGGLATALEAGWRDQPGVWIGWAGATTDEAIEPLLVRAAHRRSYTLRSVALPKKMSQNFIPASPMKSSGLCFTTCLRAAISIPNIGRPIRR